MSAAWSRLRQENFPRVVLLALSIFVIGGLLEVLIEGGAPGSTIETMGDGLWYAVVTMTSTGYGDVVPITFLGRIIGVLLMLGGLTALSVVTGAIASVLVAERIKEERGLETLTTKGHLLICGWNAYAERVLDSLFAVARTTEVVLVNELTEEQATEILARQKRRKVRFVRGDPASEPVLERASVREARAAIVVADTARGVTASDERTTLVTLTLKSIRPDLRVTVEALDDRSEPHLRRAGADDIVISGEFNGFLLSSTALEPGISQVVRPLLSLSGTELRRIDIPADLVGKSYGEIASALRQRDGFLAIAVVHEERGLTLDQLLSDDASFVDQFIKSQFNESGKELLRTEVGDTRARVNPPDSYSVGAKDAIIGIPRGA